MKLRNSFLALGLAALALPGALSCSGTPSDALDSQRTELSPLDLQARAIRRDPRFQPDIKMAAWADGETVSVIVSNESSAPLRVSAENFGVLLEGAVKPVPFDPAAHEAVFPNTQLEPGKPPGGAILPSGSTMARGTLTFKGLGDLVGQKLIFNHAHVRKSMALIQGDPQAKTPRKPARGALSTPAAPALTPAGPPAPETPKTPRDLYTLPVMTPMPF
ncbi:MAG: hypothetical protein BWZ10_00600 [candidate division BRC1 bacterium ADurb.BinA364]|nr:MAG: hypothetical protein BWZ10_00600 [candidate division BRC1 bacterium ADurb.BinA364]